VIESEPKLCNKCKSVTGGGAASVSPTFGAALWAADYTLQAALGGVRRMYFHHGTIEKCAYCFWDRKGIRAPYYGALFATAAMAKAARIVAIDARNGYVGAYATYGKTGELLKVAIINTEFLTGRDPTSRRIILGGISKEKADLRRLTSRDPMTTDGTKVFFGGRSFSDSSCELGGRENIENMKIVGNQLTINLRNSEAVLLDFQ
jgi:hypothetical protein